MPLLEADAKQIFLDTIENYSSDQWPAAVQEACGEDALLRERVAALLDAHQSSDPLLDVAIAPDTVDAPLCTERPGIQIGQYKLLEEIGEGGMGTVFMAEQTSPVRRVVAIKIVKPGMDSKAVLARFEVERQALSVMDHPNIARVLDAGSTDSGRPFFVMELIKGIPITKYCDQHRLSLRQRLELFVPVCEAIQHAHQKGVIHRDIKPTNVLVAPYEGRAVPKVIDFGLAKAAGPSLADTTLMTRCGTVVGTPEYMSPEQADLKNLDVDTRSDVYSLGALLYELLTGATPVDRKSLDGAAILEVLRIVREVEPPRPSAKLVGSDALPSIAANRKSEPDKLVRLMRGDLDWVLLKALEKDRTRRYGTAHDLARDIRRYLSDEVVEARPPSTSYRAWKFMRRHKMRVAAAGMVLLALLIGIAGTTAGFLRAEQQRRFAENQQRRAEDMETLANERLSQVEAEKKKVEEEKQAALTTLDALAKAYMTAGKLQQAIKLFEQVRDAQVKKLGADNPATLGTVSNLAAAYLIAGRLPQAIKLYEQARDVFSKKMGTDQPETLVTLSNLAVAYRVDGKLQQALPLFEQSASGIGKLGYPYKHAEQIIPRTIGAYETAGQFDMAVTWRRKWLPVLKQNAGAESLAYAGEMASLGMDLIRQKRYSDAEAILRDSLELHERLLKRQQASPWRVAWVKSVLGEAVLGLKRPVDAEPLLVSGYEGLQQDAAAIPEADRQDRLTEAIQRLIDLGTATGRQDEVKKWQTEREKYPPMKKN
jgi:serine/threonine protein kinase/tetratricopeptide (TPR) repeat protein